MSKKSLYENRFTQNKLLQYIENMPNDLKFYYSKIKEIINISAETALIYAHAKLEGGLLNALYIQVKKNYKTNADITWAIIESQDLTLKSKYNDIFYNLFSNEYKVEFSKMLDKSKKLRNKIVHGADSYYYFDIFNAIRDLLEFSNVFNDYIYSLKNFRPYRNLKGVFGKSTCKLNAEETVLIMKGLGFTINHEIYSVIKKDFKF